ncbi:MAG: hypothetical protein A2722_01060 [Candidatus Doudnabacteria bacterium RIFCSPHIGHO2_01_FULL_50_11]|uniref:Uncharacterized protein n=1 Tax=Candidatus Doudnabacteria bacterium RIFCSPHIGHO2_01_FULL_50_11 TaxID=1817828 RepID=A0A1F5PFL8_9BACT|nr:MAG: hypothetical protein A2722_01060 [Candidatus Doudnabacteria bacterium RIFCSPHIGHO2_01_FULL_50_11]HLC45231.1 hypothetical protein [Patescibacteria group bacterium]
MAKKRSAKTKKRIAIAAGAGLAVASLAAAGYYLFGSKKSHVRRKKLKSWAIRAQREIAGQLRKLPRPDERAYQAVLDKVFKKYRSLRNVDSSELLAMMREWKGQWKKLAAQVRSANTARRKPARRKRAKR